VRIFENSLFKVVVKIQRSNVNGIMNWDGKKLLIKDVPTTEDVEIGDRVIVSELSSILPPSIPVGYIVEKESTLSGVITNLVVKPYVDIKAIKNVLVILTKKENQLDSLVTGLTGELK
jgi:rod shape-determining protein MreC